MRRLTLLFLLFIALATASAGVTYQNAQSLLSGMGMNVFVLLISAPLFIFAMLVLWRIIYLTAPRRR